MEWTTVVGVTLLVLVVSGMGFMVWRLKRRESAPRRIQEAFDRMLQEIHDLPTKYWTKR